MASRNAWFCNFPQETLGECRLRGCFFRDVNGSATTDLFSGRKSPGSRVPGIDHTPSSSPSRPHVENDNKSCFNPLAPHLSCLAFWPRSSSSSGHSLRIGRTPATTHRCRHNPSTIHSQNVVLEGGMDPAFECISAIFELETSKRAWLTVFNRLSMRVPIFGSCSPIGTDATVIRNDIFQKEH